MAELAPITGEEQEEGDKAVWAIIETIEDKNKLIRGLVTAVSRSPQLMHVILHYPDAVLQIHPLYREGFVYASEVLREMEKALDVIAKKYQDKEGDTDNV